MPTQNQIIAQIEAEDAKQDAFEKRCEELAEDLRADIWKHDIHPVDADLSLDAVIGDNNDDLSPFIVGVLKANTPFQTLQAVEALKAKFDDCFRQDSLYWAEVIIDKQDEKRRGLRGC